MSAAAQLQASVAASPRVRTQAQELRSTFGSTQPVQRVIAGLERYTTPGRIPAGWVRFYLEDILHKQTHLSQADLLFLYEYARGLKPDEERVEIRPSGNHFDVAIDGRPYRARADGSCAIHVVDLVSRVRAGEEIDPEAFHAAPDEVVARSRALVKDHLEDEEGSADEIKRIIAVGIKEAEYVIETGFGERLRDALDAQLLQGSPTGFTDLFDLTYAQVNLKNWHLPKPSEARSNLKKTGFFKKKFKSLQGMMETALTELHGRAHTGVGVDFSGPTYQGPIRRHLRKALPVVRTVHEARARLSKLATRKSSAGPRKPDRELKRFRLPNGRLLSDESKQTLRRKLKQKAFVRKLMIASRRAGNLLEASSHEIAEIVKGGVVDLSDLGILSTANKFSAFGAYRNKGAGLKNDLQYLLPGSSEKSSFGKGGYQVKGLGDYPKEVIWYAERVEAWPGDETEIFTALQERNREELLRLTGGNESDVDRLLRIEDLQILERWRAGPFGVGVAAHERVGYHAGTTLPAYLLSMPMRDTKATTNVTKTMDYDHPHNRELWEAQTESMIDGIERLMDVEVPDEGIFDEGSRVFLEFAAAEPVEGEASEDLVIGTAGLLQSPKPRRNADPPDDFDPMS